MAEEVKALNKINDEYRQCYDCVHNRKKSPCPCDSCEQPKPSNFTEEE